MLTMQHRPAPDERTDRFKSLKYINNRRNQIITKSTPSPNLESRLKSWTVDRMMEALYEGRKSSQHKLAVAFWSKSGRRMLNV